MRKLSQRTATVVATGLGALVLALPGRSYADSYRYRDNSEWSSANPYTQRYYDDDDYNRSYYGEPQYGEGQGWRDWRESQHEREELDQARCPATRLEATPT